jgi:hypothetical protein
MIDELEREARERRERERKAKARAAQQRKRRQMIRRSGGRGDTLCSLLGISRAQSYRLQELDPAFPPGYRYGTAPNSPVLFDYDETVAYRDAHALPRREAPAA